MYYSSIGILALLLHIIINIDILSKPSKTSFIPAQDSYKRFLFTVLLFYVLDILWNPIYSLKSASLAHSETSLYFLTMGLSIFFWAQYVVDYLNKKNWFSNFLKSSGLIILFVQSLIIIINFFTPIAFTFDENGLYHTGHGRSIIMTLQLLMFLVTSIYMVFSSIKSKKINIRRHLAIGGFGIIMSAFIIVQASHPFMPFYTIGYLLGITLIHTFVLEDERTAREEELERLLKVEEIQEAELSSTRHMAFTDPLTGVKSKSAYQEDALCIESKIENHDLKDFGLIIFDVNDLKKTNDNLGHEEGDKIIKSAAKLICQVFKHSPVYRIGGDEFVTFLTGEDMINRNKLIKSFNCLIEKNKKEGKVTVACGYSSFNSEKDTTFAQIFGRADAKMYERKKQLKESS